MENLHKFIIKLATWKPNYKSSLMYWSFVEIFSRSGINLTWKICTVRININKWDAFKIIFQGKR